MEQRTWPRPFRRNNRQLIWLYGPTSAATDHRPLGRGHLRPDRFGLHDGLWRAAADQFRARRCLYGRRGQWLLPGQLDAPPQRAAAADAAGGLRRIDSLLL